MRTGHTTNTRVGEISIRAGLLVVALATLMALLMLVAPADVASAKKATEDAPVLNVGHRGASGYAPEHTIPAYDLALEQGADYIEIDLQMTADGVLVAMHDDTLDRTATAPEGVPEEYCTGPVIEKTLEQIKMCDVGSWFNETYPEYAATSTSGCRYPPSRRSSSATARRSTTT
jgi:glycerophosphoryl diester phosphodiesterase